MNKRTMNSDIDAANDSPQNMQTRRRFLQATVAGTTAVAIGAQAEVRTAPIDSGNGSGKVGIDSEAERLIRHAGELSKPANDRGTL